MNSNRLICTLLVIIGIALAVSVVLDPPTSEAGGPAAIGYYGEILSQGGGGLLAVAIGSTAFLTGRTRLAATTLTVYTVVALAYFVWMRLVGPTRLWPYVGLWLVVLVVAVVGVRRVVEPKSGPSMLGNDG